MTSSKIIQSQDFKCAFCNLNCTAHKIEITNTAQDIFFEVQVVHTVPACEEFINMSAPDFIRAGEQKILDVRKRPRNPHSL